MVKRDEQKIENYFSQIAKKIADLHLWFEGDIIPYLEYCKRKCDDFPQDVNYHEAVKRAYKIFL